MPSGGYRRPANPAPVSGPGALSRRTDGAQPTMNMTGLPYGEGQTYRDQQAAAPMPQAGPPTGGMPMPGGPTVVPLDAPSANPGEPITAGAPFGPGPGAGLTAPVPTRRVTDLLMALMGNDLAGDLADLYLEAEARGI